MDCSCSEQVPGLIEYAKVFATPFVAVIAAGITGTFAYLQWRAARDKLRLDLFDKRYAFYEVVRKTLRDVLDDKAPPSFEMLYDFNAVLGESEWLFDRELFEFLDQQLTGRMKDYIRNQSASTVNQIISQMPPDMVVANEREAESSRRFMADRKWLFDEFIFLPKRFSKYMKLKG